MLTLLDIPEERREKAERWIKLVSGHTSSGLTIKNYCHKEGVNPSTFYYWSNYLHGKISAPSSVVHKVKTTGKTKDGKLIAVKVRQPHIPLDSVAKDGILCTLRFPRGFLLEVYDTQVLSCLLNELA